MNLSSKIDRLRGRVFRDSPAAAGLGSGQLRSDLSRRTDVDIQPEKLAEALRAELSRDGLLMRSRICRLPADGVGIGDLTRLPEVHGLTDPDWLYIDTETTGLSGGTGSLAFMVGAARYRGGGRLEMRQYVLASFAAEPHLLEQLFNWVGQEAVLVSYNGRSFDLPLLNTRLSMHRIDVCPGSLRHLDLMYSVRRAYRDHWPDCRLQTAEKRLLGFYRQDDLPGAEAPAAWQSWLRAGATVPLARVLDHNHQDVLSLALLHRRLLSVYAGSTRPGVNHAAVGRAWRDAGQFSSARRVWEGAGDCLDDKGSLQLAALYRRLGEWSRAEAIWLRLHAKGNASAALALSKYYEHRRRDLHRAMDYARYCDVNERETRSMRLRGKMANSPQLSLLRSAS